MPTEQLLSKVLSEFARTMLTDFPIQAILDHLVGRIVHVLPITSAGVTLISPGSRPHYVAASDATALRYEELQTELGEGPCLLAYTTGELVAVPDFRVDTQFATFGARALEAGLVAAFTFPLRNGDTVLGALDLYRESPGDLDADSLAAAQTLADVASAYLINAQTRADLSEATVRSRENALHDALTGLPNRLLLLERLDHAVLRCARSEAVAAVLFLDLDEFKAVNDEHGHAVGDALLIAVANRLTAVLRPGDTLARLSGDEFVVLCEDIDGPEHADVIGERVGEAISQPFLLSGVEIRVTASVGIAFAGPGAELPEHLIREADTAMYQAKRKGGARHQTIDLRDQHLADERADLERDLGRARERRELDVHYQPIVTTVDGCLAGFEALVRWNHPRRGVVMPAVLIPLAEDSGQIMPLGRWVLDVACRAQRRWSNGALPVAVNVSAHQLMSPDFASVVAAVLVGTGTDPGQVTLEVTESVFVEDSHRALTVMNELKALGVRLALDDFGTGYSSLSHLKQFPIDIVKIDRSFTSDLGKDPAGQAIVVAVIELAHTMGKEVVAEGVETAEQREVLESLGCDRCQGFYFGRPIVADAVEVLVQRGDRAGRVCLLPSGAAGP